MKKIFMMFIGVRRTLPEGQPGEPMRSSLQNQQFGNEELGTGGGWKGGGGWWEWGVKSSCTNAPIS